MLAPLRQYLMPRDVEIFRARSAAPKSISGDAKLLILTQRAYQTAVTGTNGFFCRVAWSWSADLTTRLLGSTITCAICYKALAARSQVPATIKRTQVALAGGSKTEILPPIKAGIQSGELPHGGTGVDDLHDVQRKVSQESCRSLASTPRVLYA